MSGRVLTRPAADLDLINAYVTLSAFGDAGERFLESAKGTFEEFAMMPLMGSPRSFRAAELAGVRMWRVRAFRRYLIFYRPSDGGVETLRVVHSAQDIDALLDEVSAQETE